MKKMISMYFEENNEKIKTEEFLFFYKDFIWKNKEMIELVEKGQEFYKERFVNIPVVFETQNEYT